MDRHPQLPNRFVISVLGGVGAACLLAWLFLVYDTPSQHPRITGNELDYILQHLESKTTTATANVPWRSILTSLPVWSTALAKFAGSWGYYMLLTKLPAYMDDVHRLSIENVSGCNVRHAHLIDYLDSRHIARMAT